MSNQTWTDRSAPAEVDTVHLCHDANEITRQFYTELSSTEANSVERRTFLERSISRDDEILPLLSLMEIGRSGDTRWLEHLNVLCKTESRACVLGAVYGAIVSLGGFSARDVDLLFEAADCLRRGAAITVVNLMSTENAIRILSRILRHDPDVCLRREAAIRLAYLESSEGECQLRECFAEGQFVECVRAACALSALGKDVGSAHIHELLQKESSLSIEQRSILMVSLHELLSKVGILKSPPSGDQPETVARMIFRTASQWLECQRADSQKAPNHSGAGGDECLDQT